MAELVHKLEESSINKKEDNLVHDFDNRKAFPTKIIVVAVVIIVVGIISGFGLTKILPGKSRTLTTTLTGEAKVGVIVGSSDDKTFRDSAEGQLEAGGLNGEGTHKLIRPGGESQTVYLTSSVLDLNQFVGKNVRVWGETFSAKKAAWLMDVGKVEVL